MYPNVKTGVSTGFSLHKRINGRRGKLYNALWERPFPGDTRGMREGTESLTPVEYPCDNNCTQNLAPM